MNDQKRVTGWTGWIGFAGFMLIIAGVLQMIYGFAAILHQTWLVYTQSSVYLLSTRGWGWSTLFFGIFLLISGILLLSGNMFGRIMGVIFAILSLLGNLALFSAAPIWSILAVIVDAVVIYAIMAHGSELKNIAQ